MLHIKIMGGIILILLISTITTWALMKSARADRDRAKVNYETAMDANGVLSETISRLRVEKDAADRSLEERLKIQVDLEQKSRIELARKNNELKELRKKYEKVDTFLSIPLPDDFVDEWMRGQAGGENRVN